MRLRTAITAGIVVGLALTATACSSPQSPPAGGELVTLHVAVSPAAGTSAPIYYAVEHGYYEDLGLDVQLEVATDGAVVIPQILSGQLDFAMTSFESYINATAEGLPISMVAPANILKGTGSEFAAAIVPIDSTATDLSDVTVFAVPDAARNPQTELEVTALNGDYDSMEMLTAPLGSIGETVASGAAQAGHLFQPFLGMALDEGGVRVLSYITDEMTVPGAPGALFITSKSTLADQAETAELFVEGTLRAFSYASEHFEEISEYTQSAGLTDNAVRPEHLPKYPTEPMPLSDVQKFVDLYADYGYISDAPSLDHIVWTDGGAFA